MGKMTERLGLSLLAYIGRRARNARVCCCGMRRRVWVVGLATGRDGYDEAVMSKDV
jgi:hypothetical protein